MIREITNVADVADVPPPLQPYARAAVRRAGYRVWLVRVPDVRDPGLLPTREHSSHRPGAERRKS